MHKMSQMQKEQPESGVREELLRTKLTIPRLSTPLVERPLLIEHLNQSLERSVTLISAPAGFGKTTFVRSWIAEHAEQQDPPALAWVSLDEGDNDPVRFWRYTLTACQAIHIHHEPGQSALDLLEHSQQSSIENILTLFINEISRFSDKGILVLEDYHAITSPQIHEELAFLVDYLPETLHLILITRSDPPLPLARWRAHHDLYEFRATDLRFSLEEIEAFLRLSIDLPLAPEMLARLQERTEGWIAGLHLLVLALQGRKDPQEIEQVMKTFAGSHQHILEYLVVDVLSMQPVHLQSFLLQTSILNRLNGSLCSAITGRADSETILAQLEHANLFLLPLDGAGNWYRYHALFAEAMQHEARLRLGEEQLQRLFLKASHWYEEHGLPIESVETALVARDFPRTVALIEQMVDLPYFQSEYYNVRRWLEQLPPDLLATRPTLCFHYAISILFTSDRHARATRPLIEKPLSIAEQVWQAEQNLLRLGEVQTLRTMVSWWQGDFIGALFSARQAIEHLDENTIWRGICLVYIGILEFFNGHLDLARQATVESRLLNEISDNHYAIRAAIAIQAVISLASGELHQSAQIYSDLLASAEVDQDFQDQGEAHYGLAVLAYEWNDLKQAEQQIHQSQELSRRFSEEDLYVHNVLLLTCIQHTRGHTEQALQQLSSLAAYAQRPHLLREIHTWQARLAIAAGDLAAAQRWLETVSHYNTTQMFLDQKEYALLTARLDIARGSTAEALSTLQYWLREAQTRNHPQATLEILILQALAYSARKEASQACQSLRQALTLARAGGYQRIFLNEGEPLATILRTLLSETHDELLTDYVRSLLLAFTSSTTTRTEPQTSLPQDFLIEPLSPQERRVLRLLAAGRSNPEIAQELIVSVNTIKTQVQSIYHKLNVNNRQEARTTAHRLRLL